MFIKIALAAVIVVSAAAMASAATRSHKTAVYRSDPRAQATARPAVFQPRQSGGHRRWQPRLQSKHLQLVTQRIAGWASMLDECLRAKSADRRA
jgi:hypothetical protein